MVSKQHLKQSLPVCNTHKARTVGITLVQTATVQTLHRCYTITKLNLKLDLSQIGHDEGNAVNYSAIKMKLKII